jgi:CubicO group peptidase (beta-lactamase class C family)
MKLRTIRGHAAVLAVAGVLLAAIGATAQDLSGKFDEYMKAATASSFTGSVLVSRDGKVLFARGYGHANEEFAVPNAADTKFRLGSITKQFTAASILLLQERGKLNVSDPICKYLSSCPAAWTPISVHHLLTHTSGIPSYTDVKSFEEYRQLSLMTVTPAGFVETFKSKPLEFEVGQRFKYDNSGYFLLGYLIELISGRSYEAFLQENIFGPLTMTNSGYDTHDRILSNRATGYSNRNGVRINSPYLDMTVPYAAGSLYSTVNDLMTWNEALYSGKLLTAKSLEAMLTVNLGGYAYGVAVSRMHNRRVVSHAGGINGFSTELTRFPDDRVTIVLLRNADYGMPAPGRIVESLAAIVFGETYQIPSRE